MPLAAELLVIEGGPGPDDLALQLADRPGCRVLAEQVEGAFFLLEGEGELGDRVLVGIDRAGGDVALDLHRVRPVEPILGPLEVGTRQRDPALVILDHLVHGAIAEFDQRQSGDLVIQLGLELVGPRPLDGDLLEAEQLDIVGGVHLRQDVAALHAGPLGDHLEEDRCPTGGYPLPADADRESLELALDDGPLRALDPAAGLDHGIEVGAAHVGDGILLVRCRAGGEAGPSPGQPPDRGRRQGDRDRRGHPSRGRGIPSPMHCRAPLLFGASVPEGSPRRPTARACGARGGIPRGAVPPGGSWSGRRWPRGTPVENKWLTGRGRAEGTSRAPVRAVAEAGREPGSNRHHSEFVKESDSRFQIEYSMNGSNYPHWFSIHL